MSMAYIIGDKIIEDNKDLIKEIHDRGFGELQGDLLLLAPVETLYLAEAKKINIVKEGGREGGKEGAKQSSKAASKKKASPQKTYDMAALFNEFKKWDQEIAVKYYVYRDLRKKGYVARTGLKFGTYFRVYEKGIRVGEGHSHWLVHPIREEQKNSIYDLARAIRLAHSVRKKLLWAVVDSEGDVTYYKMERMQP
jgi:tRNA-intron endonuclease